MAKYQGDVLLREDLFKEHCVYLISFINYSKTILNIDINYTKKLDIIRDKMGAHLQDGSIKGKKIDDFIYSELSAGAEGIADKYIKESLSICRNMIKTGNAQQIFIPSKREVTILRKQIGSPNKPRITSNISGIGKYNCLTSVSSCGLHRRTKMVSTTLNNIRILISLYKYRALCT